MPTLVRFFIVLCVIAAAVFAAMVYLGNFVEPNTREMTVRIPSDRLEPTVIAPPPAASAAVPAPAPAETPPAADNADGAATVETAPE